MTQAPTFYRAFEDRYRGSRELIKERLRAYAGFIAPLAQLAAPATALDLGCGRGEWLELLGEAGYAARGIDLDEGMLAACRERALDVERVDALTALRALPDASVALVSAFHLVEHIPFDDVQALIREAWRVLQPGGLLIMETPNPENLTVGASSFYLDPSHERPLPPPLLDFVAEFCGFDRHRVVRLQEAVHLRGDAPLGLIDVLAGVSPDYSVVAQKQAPAPLLARFDAAFGADYGLELGTLAQRYEHQQGLARAALQRQLDEVNDSLARFAARSSELAEQQSRALHERMARLEEHNSQLEQRLLAMLASSSWRLTKPLRWAGRQLARLRAARRDGRLLRGLLRRLSLARGGRALLTAALLGAMRAVLRQPRLKSLARRLLARAPSLQARLHRLLYRAAAAPTQPQWQSDDMLSPRALRAYQELKQALDARKD